MHNEKKGSSLQRTPRTVEPLLANVAGRITAIAKKLEEAGVDGTVAAQDAPDIFQEAVVRLLEKKKTGAKRRGYEEHINELIGRYVSNRGHIIACDPQRLLKITEKKNPDGDGNNFSEGDHVVRFTKGGRKEGKPFRQVQVDALLNQARGNRFSQLELEIIKTVRSLLQDGKSPDEIIQRGNPNFSKGNVNKSISYLKEVGRRVPKK